jgi:hypothetical protein
MPGAGARGKREEEDEDKYYKPKSWLISEENGSALIGPLPKASPPVLGVWDDVEPAEPERT